MAPPAIIELTSLQRDIIELANVEITRAHIPAPDIAIDIPITACPIVPIRLQTNKVLNFILRLRNAWGIEYIPEKMTFKPWIRIFFETEHTNIFHN